MAFAVNAVWRRWPARRLPRRRRWSNLRHASGVASVWRREPEVRVTRGEIGHPGHFQEISGLVAFLLSSKILSIILYVFYSLLLNFAGKAEPVSIYSGWYYLQGLTIHNTHNTIIHRIILVLYT